MVLVLQVFRMLDFLHVDYSRDKVLQRLNDDFRVFKRPKTQDFDPYTPQQRASKNNPQSVFENNSPQKNGQYCGTLFIRALTDRLAIIGEQLANLYVWSEKKCHVDEDEDEPKLFWT